MTELLADHTELFKQFSDNESFRRWLFRNGLRRDIQTKPPPRPARQEVPVSERSWGLLASQVAQLHLEDGTAYRTIRHR